MVDIKEKQNTTKSKILETATKLFYENGYNNTYLEHIADLCEITKPLISYHYGSKADLARNVAEAYAKNNKNVISFKLYKYFFDDRRYDLQVSTAVEIRLNNLLNLSDKNVLRFHVERINADYSKALPKNDTSMPFYKIHQRRYKLNIDNDKDELTLLARAAGGAAISLLFGYISGDYDCSLEDFLDYYVGLHFKLMNIEPARIEEILDESKKIIDEIGFSFEPYFKIV